MHVVQQEGVVEVEDEVEEDLEDRVEDGVVIVEEVVLEEIAVQDVGGHVQDQDHQTGGRGDPGLVPEANLEANLETEHVVTDLPQMNVKPRKKGDQNQRNEKSLLKNVRLPLKDDQGKDQSRMMSMHRRKGLVHVQEVDHVLDLVMTTTKMTNDCMKKLNIIFMD